MPKPSPKASADPKQRPANPACSGCNHPATFHAKKDGRKARKCNAFGCTCKNLKIEKAAK